MCIRDRFGEALKIKNISQSSITGGMSFAGGPLNSYVLNSTVQMIKKIRNEENKCLKINKLEQMYLPSTPKIVGYNYWGMATL